MYNYAIRFEQDATGVAVFCRDLPELNSFGDDLKHAISEADDAIATTLSLYVDQRRSIPEASQPEDGEHVVSASAVTVAKIALWNAMMSRDMRKADLCRLLGVHQAQGDRLVDFLHTSKIEQLEVALKALNLRLSVEAQPYYTNYKIFYTQHGAGRSFNCLRNDQVATNDAWMILLAGLKLEVPKDLERPSPKLVCQANGITEAVIVAA
ncbi:type II toxin-antitoxin system HicB family antitoxin [Pseudomonas sp. HLG18]|uniref:type II toxin-antitoxin system HicB family antitoxin n=1 Tax=Pseudomonas sp. HLG18 TaxID=3449277 RepID=UPI003F747AEC